MVCASATVSSCEIDSFRSQLIKYMSKRPVSFKEFEFNLIFAAVVIRIISCETRMFY